MLALVCLNPHGDFQVEFDNFDLDNMDEAREYSATMGSRWYFYPIRVLADADTYEILEAPGVFEFLVGENYREIQGTDTARELV